MKKNMLMTFGAMALALAGVSAHAVNVVKSGTTVIVSPTLTAKGKSFGVGLYANNAFKVGDSWTLVPEIAASLGVVDGGKGKLDLAFGYMRVVASGPVLKKWSDKRTFKLEYRYMLPADHGSQLAGNLGVIGVRPVLNWAFTDKLSTMVRGMTQIPLNRNGYQLNRPGQPDSDYKGQVGNAIIAFGPEILLGYDITPKWAVSTYWSPAFSIRGPDKGTTKTTYGKKLAAHQHGVTYAYNDKITLDAYVLEEEIAFKKGFKLFDAARLQYVLEGTFKF